MPSHKRMVVGGQPQGAPSCEITFEELAKEILQTHASRNSLRTYATTKSTLGHLLKTFSGERLSGIRSEDFFLKHVPRTKSENPKRNLNNDRKIFIQVMYAAYRRGITSLPPFGIPKPSIEKEVGRELSDDEIRLLLTSCKNTDLHLQIRIALKTGMRLREMLGLKWAYICFNRGTVKLPPEVTKTRRGREFPVARELLLEIANRSGNKSEYVFPGRGGEKPRFDNKWHWKGLLRVVGIKARWHDLRHSSATKKVRAGIPLAIIARELGMSELVLKRVYMHLNVEDLRASAEAVKTDF